MVMSIFKKEQDICGTGFMTAVGMQAGRQARKRIANWQRVQASTENEIKWKTNFGGGWVGVIPITALAVNKDKFQKDWLSNIPWKEAFFVYNFLLEVSFDNDICLHFLGFEQWAKVNFMLQ